MLIAVKRLLWMLTLVVLGMGTLLLILQNPQRSEFSFLNWVTPELPFSVFLVMAFVAGGVSFLIVSLWVIGRRSSSKGS
jgi:uncharacterized integral membrane protein